MITMKGLHLKLVALFGRLVPRQFRSEWKDEWMAELRHREIRGSGSLIRPSLGAFWDALAMQSRRLEEEFWQDVRYGVRMFSRNKAVTLTAILSLAVGIGANTAIFSVIDAVMLKNLPVRNPDELVLFQWSTGPNPLRVATIAEGLVSDPDSQMQTGGAFPYWAFERIRDQGRALASVFAFARLDRANVVVDNHAEIVTGQYISGGYFEGLGVGVAAGRIITNEDDHPAAPPAAMIGYQYWKRRFASDPDLLGRSMTVNGASFTIVGIAPQNFSGTLQVNDSPDIYIPLSFEPVIGAAKPGGSSLQAPYLWWVWIMGRENPGVSREQIRDDAEPLFQQAALEGFEWAVDQGRMQSPTPIRERSAPQLTVVSGSQGLNDRREDFAFPLVILTAFSAFVLFTVCANVANLLLSRSAARFREMAIRMTMGASRFRLIRQLSTEGLLLSFFGGGFGLATAWIAKELFLRWGPWNGPTAGVEAAMDIRGLGFTAGLTLLTILVFGLVPSIVATRQGLSSTMKASAHTSSGRRSYLTRMLLIGQIGMSIVLLVAAALFGTTLNNFHRTVVASDPSSLLQFNVDASLTGYDRARSVLLWDQMVERIRAVPGVQSVTLTGATNMSPSSVRDADTGEGYFAHMVPVGPNFSETIGIPLVAGRDLDLMDTTGSSNAVLANETFASMFFPDTNPIGRRLENPGGGQREIVGVVRNAEHVQLRNAPAPVIYLPYPVWPIGHMVVQVRGTNDSADLFPAIRSTVAEVDSNIALGNVRTLADQIDESLATERMLANLSTLFGIAALSLTCIGLYGVLAYAVVRRRNEFGIRMAMGAKRTNVLRLVLMEGLFITATGIVIGTAGALAAGRYVSSILFGITPHDPGTILVVMVIVAAVSAAAALIPAWRASRVDPVEILRYE